MRCRIGSITCKSLDKKIESSRVRISGGRSTSWSCIRRCETKRCALSFNQCYCRFRWRWHAWRRGHEFGSSAPNLPCARSPQPVNVGMITFGRDILAQCSFATDLDRLSQIWGCIKVPLSMFMCAPYIFRWKSASKPVILLVFGGITSCTPI